MISTNHQPEPCDDDNEHDVICGVCFRLGKTVDVGTPTGDTTRVTLWYSGMGISGPGITYVANLVCAGNANWLDT